MSRYEAGRPWRPDKNGSDVCDDQFFALSTSLFLAISRTPAGLARGRADEKPWIAPQFFALSTGLFLAISRTPAGLARGRADEKPWIAPQFFALSTSLFLAIHGIMARSFSPTCSIS